MIQIRGVNKTYLTGEVSVAAVKAVSLTIATGEFVAIMGASGSGKSTLMHCLGLLDRFDEGDYVLDGNEVNSFSDDELAVLRNKTIGFVFQQFHLLPRTPAYENVELPLLYAGVHARKQRALESLYAVGLKERVNHMPNQLSGGQQQRVAIARALVNDPKIIFADEPTGNLDTKSKQEIINILKDLNNAGKTIVIVTHEPEIAAYAKRVIVMRDGVVISDTAPAVPVNKADDNGVPAKGFSGVRPRSAGMRFGEYFAQAWRAIYAHKLRAFLSILGILIGIAAVIAMLSIGEGARKSIEKEFASLGSNLLMMHPGSFRNHGVAMSAGSVTRFTMVDVKDISALPGVTSVSPSVRGAAQVVYADKNWNTQVEGVGPEYEQLRASVPVVGNFFNAQDIQFRSKVVLLGATVARELFGVKDPVGETIKINLINFKVIGVLPSKGASGFRDQDDTLLIPVTTAMYRLLGKVYIDSIYIQPKSDVDILSVQEDIRQMVMKRHRIREDKADDAFEIRNMSDIRSAFESTTNTMSLLLGGIAAISLFVGGIGIMNIMLVSVSERTREIGLRKAIGAANRDIMIQFLIEAVLMCFIGGLAGVAAGSGVSFMITKIAGWNAAVSPFSIILSTLFSLLIGVLFGLWPAKTAARLNPIDALRYE